MKTKKSFIKKETILIKKKKQNKNKTSQKTKVTSRNLNEMLKIQ